MLIVGNDVVDLSDPDASFVSEKFISRICIKAEIEILEPVKDCADKLWCFWSAKETAFKIIQRSHLLVNFHPKQFIVDYNKGEVCFQERRIRVEWVRKGDCLTCMGHSEELNLKKKIFSVTSSIPDFKVFPDEKLTLREMQSVKISESRTVRLFTKRLVTQYLGIKWSKTEIIRHRNNVNAWLPPEICYDGDIIPGSCISLAHHGRFMGCIFSVS